MSRKHLTAHHLNALGLTLIAVSALFPWMRVTVLNETRRFGPLWTNQFRAASILLLMAMVVIAGLVAIGKASSATLAVPTQLWGTFAVFFWIAGVGLQGLLPRSIIPDGAIPISHFSLFFAMIGPLLISTTSLASVRTDISALEIPVVPVFLSAGCIALVLSSRDVTWVKLETDLADWKLGADVIPVLGGSIAVVGLTITVLLVVGLFTRSKWIYLISAAAGGLLMTFGFVSLMAESLLKRVARSGARAIGINSQSLTAVKFSFGPWILLMAGLMVVIFSTYEVAVTDRSATRPSDRSSSWAANQEIRGFF